MNYQLNFAAVWRDFDTLLAGLGLGLELALVSIAIGCVIGLLMAFALLSKHRALRVLASVYVTVVRNTPILVLILLIYFACRAWAFVWTRSRRSSSRCRCMPGRT